MKAAKLHEVSKATETMNALVYRGAGKRALETRPKPVIQASTDAVLKVIKTTICGTDLHILKGDVPEVKEGRVLGHEGVGMIETVGEAVSSFKPGDRVLISCITADGRCEYCRKAMYSHCENGGWLLGRLIDGTQAEYVRIPYADTSLYHVPKGVEEDGLVMLSDIFPTGYECGVLNGKVKPGDTVAIIGAGPIGLATLITAQFYSPSTLILVDADEYRLEVGKRLGATAAFNASRENPVEAILALTGGRGVDVAVEAVGIPETFDYCQRIVAPGGHIANVGVHGVGAELRLQELWSKNITITTRLVDTESTPLLLRTLQAGRFRPEKLVTHRFKLDDLMRAYDVFGNASKERVIKVIIANDS